MEVVRPKTDKEPTTPTGANKRKTARKAVGFMEALISTLREPSVRETIASALAHQKKVAAERSFAGQADNVFTIATDPRVLAVAEILTAAVKKQVVVRKR
jgi:hypothetical protein